MKIYVLNKVLEYENNKESINIILEKLKKIVEKSNCVLSHLEIDGQDVYDDFYKYFSNNIYDIKEVKVVTKTIRDLEKGMLQEVGEYFEEIIPEVEELSYEFFKGPTRETFIKLIELFEKIKWIIDIFDLIDSSDEIEYIIDSYEVWNLYARDIYSLQEIVEDFRGVFAEDELIFIPEILCDEIVPLFRDMKDKLDLLVYKKENEGMLN